MHAYETRLTCYLFSHFLSYFCSSTIFFLSLKHTIKLSLSLSLFSLSFLHFIFRAKTEAKSTQKSKTTNGRSIKYVQHIKHLPTLLFSYSLISFCFECFYSNEKERKTQPIHLTCAISFSNYSLDVVDQNNTRWFWLILAKGHLDSLSLCMCAMCLTAQISSLSLSLRRSIPFHSIVYWYSSICSQSMSQWHAVCLPSKNFRKKAFFIIIVASRLTHQKYK